MAELKLEIPPELKTRVGSILLGKLLIRLLKQDIFERYQQTGEVTDEDWEFCEKIDWHPVDWLPLKKSFIKELEERRKGPFIKLSAVEDVFKE